MSRWLDREWKETSGVFKASEVSCLDTRGPVAVFRRWRGRACLLTESRAAWGRLARRGSSRSTLPCKGKGLTPPYFDRRSYPHLETCRSRQGFTLVDCHS